MEILSSKNKAGCPVCNGVAAKSCARCYGRTKMWHWFNTPLGWTHFSQLKGDEFKEAELLVHSIKR